MRKQKELVVQQVTPGAGIAVAQLYEIDRAVEFCAPAKRLDSSHARVNLNERAGAQQRIEGEVVQADVTVLAVANVEMLD